MAPLGEHGRDVALDGALRTAHVPGAKGEHESDGRQTLDGGLVAEGTVRVVMGPAVAVVMVPGDFTGPGPAAGGLEHGARVLVRLAVHAGSFLRERLVGGRQDDRRAVEDPQD